MAISHRLTTLTQTVLGRVSATGSGSYGDGSGGDPIGLSTNLFDSQGYRWDIQRDGNINDGTSDAYDGGMFNTAMSSFNTGLLEDNGREVLIGPSTIGAIQGQPGQFDVFLMAQARIPA